VFGNSEPRILNTTQKTRRAIVLVLLLGGGAFLWLRRSGVPGELAEAHYVGPFFQRLFGARTALCYPDGSLAWLKVYRGTAYAACPGSSAFVVPLVRGDYFAPDGRLASMVRGGDGAEVTFYANGLPERVTLYRYGRVHPVTMSWHSNGVLQRYVSIADDGHGHAADFDALGNRTSKSEF
jgi:hypothetical protein